MSELSQNDADQLFLLEKVLKEENPLYDFPVGGDKVSVPLVSADKKEDFIFDVTSSSISISKYTFQNRARKIEILRRLDLEGAPHCNPPVEKAPLDFLEKYIGEEIPCPHIHIYVEGFGTRWAIPVEDVLSLPNAGNDDIAESFLRYCNVTEIPQFRKRLA